MKTKASCTHCGAPTVEYKHSLSTGLARCLRAIFEAGNFAHVGDLPLSYNDRCNFQKLRYWDLVRYADDPSGSKAGGWWALTPLGQGFVAGVYTAPKSVWTYRGSRVRYEGEQGTFATIQGPYKTRPEYAQEAKPMEVSQ